MNREILYRGKRVDNGEWIFGDLIENQCRFYIYQASNITTLPWDAKNQIAVCGYEIEPETRGEYTGLTDKNGKRIFEGDIIKAYHTFTGALLFFGLVRFEALRWQIEDAEFGDDSDLEESSLIEYVIIGNIHDNPELLNHERTTKED